MDFQKEAPKAKAIFRVIDQNGLSHVQHLVAEREKGNSLRKENSVHGVANLKSRN